MVRPETLASLQTQDFSFRVSRQDISEPTIWKINDARSTVVMHLDGPIHHLETELRGAGALHEPPMKGEVTVIPAGADYTSFARGGVVQYAELQLQIADGNGEIDVPRAGYYDHRLLLAIEQLAFLATMPNAACGLELQSGLLELQQHLRQSLTSKASRRPTRNERGFSAGRIAVLEEYIHDNLDREITLDALAALMVMTPHRLLRAFRQTFSMTPAQYVIHCRLRRARWLLKHSRKEILDIAFCTGFCNHSHLTHTFRRFCGVTPAAYRKSARTHWTLGPASRAPAQPPVR